MNILEFAFKKVSYGMIAPIADNNLYLLVHSLIFKTLNIWAIAS
ncbi:hypothetical protein [Nostoc sp. KVJ20]|nr:hypothetical protein [Nostoc sp. KVJ20]